MRGRPAKRVRRLSRAWGSWHPVASGFHFGTKDIRWATDEEAKLITAAQVQRAGTDPAPPPFKQPRGRGIALPIRRPTGEFTAVLLDRRTWRGFGRRLVTRTQLGLLLDLTFGVRLEGTGTAGEHLLLKTSPSAGARHPIEAYVLAVRVRDLSPGLYHFSPLTRRLHLVRRGSTREQLVAYLSNQWWYGDAAALILMTAVLPRVRWRYTNPRAYRSVLLDAGHVCQTFCLVATWLKLAPFCTQALADSRIERDLGVDGVDEVILYAAGVGSRPADGRWVQWPGYQPDR
jgi:SagB-type dehydrogenase family enzyme